MSRIVLCSFMFSLSVAVLLAGGSARYQLRRAELVVGEEHLAWKNEAGRLVLSGSAVRMQEGRQLRLMYSLRLVPPLMLVEEYTMKMRDIDGKSLGCRIVQDGKSGDKLVGRLVRGTEDKKLSFDAPLLLFDRYCLGQLTALLQAYDQSRRGRQTFRLCVPSEGTTGNVVLDFRGKEAFGPPRDRIRLKFYRINAAGAAYKVWADNYGRPIRISEERTGINAYLEGYYRYFTLRRESPGRFAESVRSVSTTFATSDAVIDAVLTLPTGRVTGLPGIVVVSDSRAGFQKAGLAFQRDLADYLAAGGAAVLRYGLVSNGYNRALKRLLAALKYLGSRNEVEKENLIIIGHGRGALLAGTAARMNGKVVLLVLLAARGETMAAELTARLKELLAAAHVDKAAGHDALLALDALTERIDNGLEPRPENLDLARELALFNEIVSSRATMKGFVKTDPLEKLDELTMPVLVVNAAKDPLVGSALLVPLERALDRSSVPECDVKLFSGLDHLFSRDGKKTDPRFLAFVRGWIAAHGYIPR